MIVKVVADTSTGQDLAPVNEVQIGGHVAAD
jgi:hypothetical protein